MSYKLFFDTSDKDQIKVTLYKDGKLKTKKTKSQKYSSQALLPLIDEICKDNKITPGQISEIEFNPGPGSYTGLKVGASIANAFGWYLTIPVNGRKKKIMLPRFDG